MKENGNAGLDKESREKSHIRKERSDPRPQQWCNEQRIRLRLRRTIANPRMKDYMISDQSVSLSLILLYVIVVRITGGDGVRGGDGRSVYAILSPMEKEWDRNVNNT